MTEENKNPAPASPEVQSPAVRRELDQEDVTHQGQPVEVDKVNQADSQQHMGTVETDVTPIQPPMEGPSDLVGENGDDSTTIAPDSELTPG